MINDFSNMSFLTRKQVEAKTALSRSTIYDLMAKGRFPKPIKLSTRAVRWSSVDVQGWFQERISESRGLLQ
jgi:prophage regulatory protein